MDGGPPSRLDFPSLPAFAPDGTRVAYVRDGNLHIANVDGSNPVRLTRTLRDVYDPAWGPDARRLVFNVKISRYRDRGEVYTIGADGSDLRLIANDGGKASWSRPRVRPTDPRIRLTAPAPGVFASVPGGATSAAVRVAVHSHAHGWSWRLDHAFPVEGHAGGVHVARGSETQVDGLRPGETHVVYVALVDERGHMLRRPATDAGVFRVPSAEPERTGPAGGLLVITGSGAAPVLTMRADGTERVGLATGNLSFASALAWAQDGSRVAFTARETHDGVRSALALYLSPFSPFSPRAVVSDVAGHDLSFSPGGDHIVYAVKDEGVRAVSLEDGGVRALANGEYLSGPRYSSSGEYVAYHQDQHAAYPGSGGESTLHAVRSEGGAVFDVAGGLTAVEAFRWHPTTGALVIEDSGVIYILDTVDAEPKSWLRGSLLDWSPDGLLLAYRGAYGGIALHDMAADASRELVRGDFGKEVLSVAWSPDGSRLGYITRIARQGSYLRIVAVADGAVQLGEDWSIRANSVAWSPVGAIGAQTTRIVGPPDGTVYPASVSSMTFQATAAGAWRWRRNGYFPASGQAGGSAGSSDPITSGGLQAGRVYTIRVAAVDDSGDLLVPRDVTSVTFTVTIPADANADGIVDMLDLVYVAANLGRWGDFTDGEPDVDGDGFVRIQDLMAVAAHFGERIAPTAAAAPSMPRPSSADALADWTRRAERANAQTQEQRDGLTALRALLASVAPSTTALLPNYPNPFNPETWIPFDLAEAGPVTVTLYDMRGRRVRTLDLGAMPAGRYRERARAPRWDGRNDVGEPAAGGVYIAELRAGSHVERRRLVLLK